MNVLPDPSKRATINSLLNPTQVPPFPAHIVPALQVGPQSTHVQEDNSGASYASHPSNSYSLKAANWEGGPEEERRKSNSQSPSRQYQHHPGAPLQSTSSMSEYSGTNPHAPRMSTKPRAEDYGGASWQQQPQPPQQSMSSMPYGAPILPPIYSEERTAMANDFPSQGNYSSSYNEENRPHENAPLWQNAERVSVRLVARNSVPPQPMAHAEAYSASQYPSQPQAYAAAQQQPYPQQVALPPPTEASQTQATKTKRSHPDGDDTQAPKAKRTKGKNKSTGSTPATPASGSSKRGYNSRKRNEAAMISAQNAEALSRARQEGGQGETNGEPGSSDSNKALVPELQFARCMSNRYRNEDFPRCVSCTRRWAGDTCRFQGIRFFMRDSNRNLVGVSFAQHHGRPEGPVVTFPTEWNREFQAPHAKRTKLSIAKALLPTLQAEKQHLDITDVVRRQREVDVRATCDTCMTSLFSSSWMCRVCGREVCQDCFKQVQDLTIEPPNCTPQQKAQFAARRERHSHANPFFLGCTKRIEHNADYFTAVTRFVADELEKTIAEMELVVKDADAEDEADNQENGKENEQRCSGDGPTSPGGGTALSQARSDVYSPHQLHQTNSQSQQSSTPLPQHAASGNSISDPDTRWMDPNFPDPLTTPIYDDFTPAHTPEHITSIPCYRLQVIPANYYDPPRRSNLPESSSSLQKVEPSFSELWKKGQPILVKNLRSRFSLPWSPRHFIEQYGDKSCLIVECQNDTNKRVTIEEFFSEFGKYEGRTECWKLKDWPPTSDFKSAYPNLYDDFAAAVPVPDYVRRDGVYNLGSHFPVNAVGPDLGPKMYNSFASSQESGSKGSTRLHMDMADALNVMLFAAPCKDGSDGYAVWDLFRAEDSDKIRAFLKKKYASVAASAKPQTNDGLQTQIVLAHDPIHGQQFYLDVQLRRELWEQYQVKSYRVYQRPGDGVFIPAGCAHQVANMSDCMKIATDFVSPENIDRCEKLTKEFREQNQAKAWKEDVLQLRTMMWFAWLSCTLKEEQFKKEEALRLAGQGSFNDGETNLGVGHDIAGVRLIERRS